MIINKSNRVQDVLGIQYPIIQAPLNWLTNAKFVAAVSNAGALGILGFNAGPHAYDQNVSLEEKIRGEIKEIKKLTDKPFGINMKHLDRKSTRLNSSHVSISYAVFC